MLSEEILFAINDTDDAVLEGVGLRLGYRYKTAPARLPVRKIILIAAAVLTLMAVTACSVYLAHWSKGLQARYNATQEEMRQADESGLSVYPEETGAERTSATAGGVTVSAEQTVVDADGADIILRIDGLELPEGKVPAIGGLGVLIDGESPGAMSGGFVEPIPESGPFEYSISISAYPDEQLPLTGREITVRIYGLGYETGKLEHELTVEDTFELSWTLQGSAEQRTVQLGTALEGTGVIIESAELTPTSVYVTGRMDSSFDGWETLELFQPRPVGLRLNDGTELMCLFPWGGGEGYLDEDEGLFFIQVSSDRLIQPDRVEALLFAYTYAGGKTQDGAELIAVPLE